jgi:hypothetical protein
VPELADEVGADRGEQHRVAGQGVDGVDHRGQRLVVDHHQLGGVGALLGPLGQHHRDRFAHEPHPVDRQVVAGHLGRRHAGHRRQVDVGAGHHVHHPGGRPCLVDVDPEDLRVGHGRAHVGGAHRAGQAQVGEVGRVLAACGQQARVLQPQDTVPQDAHRRAPRSSGRDRGVTRA